MNRIPSESKLRHYRCRYPAGTRIQLDADMDDPQPISAGTKGTIIAIDDMAQALMKWDNGRSLSLVLDVDKFHMSKSERFQEKVEKIYFFIRQVSTIQSKKVNPHKAN